MTEESCETCRFFAPKDSNGQAVGNCQRHPPTVFMVAMPQGPSVLARPGSPQQVQVNMQFPSAWPFVQGKHWCGEFQRPWKLSKAHASDGHEHELE